MVLGIFLLCIWLLDVVSGIVDDGLGKRVDYSGIDAMSFQCSSYNSIDFVADEWHLERKLRMVVIGLWV